VALASDRENSAHLCPIYTRQQLTRCSLRDSTRGKRGLLLPHPTVDTSKATRRAVLWRQHKYLSRKTQRSFDPKLPSFLLSNQKTLAARQWMGSSLGQGRRWTGGGKGRGPRRRTSCSSSMSGSTVKGGGTRSPSIQVPVIFEN
jgi:hypothetical protein